MSRCEYYCLTAPNAPDTVAFTLFLVISPNSDEFTTEAAWDLDGNMPRSLYALEFGEDKVFHDPIHFRTDILWTDSQFGHWWTLVANPNKCEETILYQDPVEDCLPLIDPAIKEAAAKLHEYVLPLFETITLMQARK